MKPIEFTASKLIPQGISDQITDALSICIEKIMWGSEYLYDEKHIIETLAKYDSNIKRISDIRQTTNIDAMNRAALEFVDWNTSYAGVQGGATGAMGLMGLPANIPALFSIVFRMIQQIAICYGFDPTRPEEKDFALKILAVTATSTKKDKDVAVQEIELSNDYLKAQFSKIATMIAIKQTQVVLLKKTWKSMGDKSALIMLRSFLKTLGFNLTKKKALQLIPAVSAVLGAAFDLVYCRDVGKIANMMYRQRRIDTESMEVVTVEYTDLIDDNDIEENENPLKELADEIINPFAEEPPLPLSDASKIIVKTLICMGEADGNFDDDEIQYIIDYISSIGESISLDEIKNFSQEVKESGIKEILLGIPNNDNLFREELLRVAMISAQIDGIIDESEKKIIQEMVKALNIPMERFNQLYAETSDMIPKKNTGFLSSMASKISLFK